MRYTVEMARLLLKLKNDKATKKYFAQVMKRRLDAYTKSWQTIYSGLPDVIYNCSGQCIAKVTVLTTKTTILAGSNDQLALLNEVYKRVLRATKSKTNRNKAASLLKRGKDSYTQFTRLVQEIPDIASTDGKCS